MTKFSRFIVLATILISCLGATSSRAQSTVYVGTCGPAHIPSYPTIQQAVTATLTGGTVWVCPGTYHEQVEIDPTQSHVGNLRISGVTGWNTPPVILEPPAGGLVANATDLSNGVAVAAQIYVHDSGYVKISNITVDGTGNKVSSCLPDVRGIYYQNTSGTIQSVTTQNQMLAASLNTCYSGAGIFVQGGYGNTASQTIHIEGNTVQTFQKNGITADGTTLYVYVNTNYVNGLGPTSGAQQYGIQLSEGATGEVKFNSITNLIAVPSYGINTADVAVGTLIYASPNVSFLENDTNTTQYGVITVSDPSYGYPGNPQGTANNTTINQNVFYNTQAFDAVDACSNNNWVDYNLIFNSTESGVHLDSTCGGTGTGTEVKGNLIDTACAGILQGATPNDIDPNLVFNTTYRILAGDVCPVTPAAATPAVTANAALATTASATAVAPRITPYR